LSPRAAARLETLGFEMVFDYVAGKQDWLASDLPIEGQLAQAGIIGKLADRNVPTCFLTEKANEALNRPGEESQDFCVVVDNAGVVLGLLRNGAVDNGNRSIDQLMEPGPTTFRPHLSIEQMADYAEKKNLDPILVTTSDGRLVGALRTKDLRRTSSHNG